MLKENGIQKYVSVGRGGENPLKSPKPLKHYLRNLEKEGGKSSATWLRTHHGLGGHGIPNGAQSIESQIEKNEAYILGTHMPIAAIRDAKAAKPDCGREYGSNRGKNEERH